MSYRNSYYIKIPYATTQPINEGGCGFDVSWITSNMHPPPG